MEQSKLDRINELARISRERELTQAEWDERAVLRAEYIAEWRANTLQALENTYIVEPDGTKHHLPKKPGK